MKLLHLKTDIRLFHDGIRKYHDTSVMMIFLKNPRVDVCWIGEEMASEV